MHRLRSGSWSCRGVLSGASWQARQGAFEAHSSGSWRSKTPKRVVARSSSHLKSGGTGRSWQQRHQPCCHSGSEMPAMATRRRRGRSGSSCRVRARWGGSERLRRSKGRKPWSLRVGHPQGSHDNKSVAEVGERHHPLAADGISVSGVTWGSSSPGPKSLTRRVCRWAVKLVSEPRAVWRFSCALAAYSSDEVERSQLKAFWVLTLVLP